MLLSIVLATYNESKNIIPLFNLINKEIANKFKFEIIYVDDDSTDGTQDNIKFLNKPILITIIDYFIISNFIFVKFMLSFIQVGVEINKNIKFKFKKFL